MDSRPLVLIVDDEPEFADPMAALLNEGLGVRTIARHDPLEALRTLDSERPAVVISDYLMPHLNGVDFLREVARRQPGVQSIIITGTEAEVDFRPRGREDGFLGVLEKPVSWRTVAALIRSRVAVA